MCERVSHGYEELLFVERFVQVLTRAAAQHFIILSPIAERRDHDHGEIGVRGLENGQESGSAHARHQDVGDDQVKLVTAAPKKLHGIVGGRLWDDAEAFSLENLHQRLAQLVVVVHQQYGGYGSSW